MSDLEFVLKWIDEDLPAAIDRLSDLLRVASVSADPLHAADCRAMAEAIRLELAAMGFSSTVVQTAGHPIVLARTDFGRPKRVLFYGHYDVQPVDPIELWRHPPFSPTREWTDGRERIVARGAEDDKGQVSTFLEAVRAWLAVTGSLPVDVTFVIEGEEEIGSASFRQFLLDHRGSLGADVALICDTEMWDRETPAITTSLRGLVCEEVTITAADRDLHSGGYGGAARNPIHVLAAILADLHDDGGGVSLPGFYQGVTEPSPEKLDSWRELDFTAAHFLGRVGLAVPAGEAGRLLFEMVQSRPTCDVNGIVAGYTGEGFKTVIPSTATAKVSFRLVGKQSPEAVSSAFRGFVRARLPIDCKADFRTHESSAAFEVDDASPFLAAAARALADEWGRQPVMIGTGGSIPIVGDLKELLGQDSLMVGFGLDDDDVHSPNEKYDVECLRRGARSWARVLEQIQKIA